RAGIGDLLAVDDVGVTHERPDLQMAVDVFDAVEPGDPVDVDEVARGGQAQLHHRKEALSPRQDPPFVSQLCEERRRLLERGGRRVLEWRWVHVSPPTGEPSPPPTTGPAGGPFAVRPYSRPVRRVGRSRLFDRLSGGGTNRRRRAVRGGYLHGRDERVSQYSSGCWRHEARSPNSSSASRVRASRLERSWATEVAPDRTTSAHGRLRQAAMATASGFTPSGRDTFSTRMASPPATRRPLASASLTITPHPARCASSSAGSADCSRRFQVAWTQRKGLIPSTSTSRARRMMSAWRGPLTDRPTTRPSWDSSASRASTARSSSTPLSRVAEWI